MPGPNGSTELRKEIADAFLYAHSRLNSNTGSTLEASAFLYALIELLSEKGIISEQELDERKRRVGERLAVRYRENGCGVALQEPETDKYSYRGVVEIDCGSRLHLCHAACCKLPFALSKQDVSERIVKWDLGRPYMIAQGEDGYCRHLDGRKQCTIRENRPLPCRAYDCRKDRRIWLDFEQGLVNPDISRPDWPACTLTQAAGEDAGA
jgi:Fe-S-cluster containining protein